MEGMINYHFSIELPVIDHIDHGRSDLWCSLHAEAAKHGITEDNRKLLTTSNATTLRIESGTCNQERLTSLPLKGFPDLQSLVIGDECFQHVDVVTISGMQNLSSISVGSNSFTNHKNSHFNDTSRHFSITDCPQFDSLSVGPYSFSDYTTFVASSNRCNCVLR